MKNQTNKTTKTKQSVSSFSTNFSDEEEQKNFIDCSQQQLTKFEDFELIPQDLLEGIYGYGYEYPSEIQKVSLSKILPEESQNKDIIIQSQSGSGKTAAFLIGVLAKIEKKINQCQALIIVPTRELVLQIYKIAIEFSKYQQINVIALTGQNNVFEDICKLKKNKFSQILKPQQLIIGTPGRILQMIEQKHLKTEKIKKMVFDEADEILGNENLLENIKKIFSFLPNEIQVCLSSATMPKQILELSEKNIMRPDPITILLERDNIFLKQIKQYYVKLEESEWKYEVLENIFDMLNFNTSCIIFANKTETVIDLYEKLKETQKFSVVMIHGKMDIAERDQNMKLFREKKANILVTTDVIARGIDVQSVQLVINYELTRNWETYIHRIGRCGRFSKLGVSISFVLPTDVKFLLSLEKQFKTEIEELPEDLANIFDQKN